MIYLNGNTLTNSRANTEHNTALNRKIKKVKRKYNNIQPTQYEGY